MTTAMSDVDRVEGVRYRPIRVDVPAPDAEHAIEVSRLVAGMASRPSPSSASKQHMLGVIDRSLAPKVQYAVSPLVSAGELSDIYLRRVLRCDSWESQEPFMPFTRAASDEGANPFLPEMVVFEHRRGDAPSDVFPSRMTRPGGDASTVLKSAGVIDLRNRQKAVMMYCMRAWMQMYCVLNNLMLRDSDGRMLVPFSFATHAVDAIVHGGTLLGAASRKSDALLFPANNMMSSGPPPRSSSEPTVTIYLAFATLEARRLAVRTLGRLPTHGGGGALPFGLGIGPCCPAANEGVILTIIVRETCVSLGGSSLSNQEAIGYEIIDETTLRILVKDDGDGDGDGAAITIANRQLVSRLAELTAGRQGTDPPIVVTRVERTATAFRYLRLGDAAAAGTSTFGNFVFMNVLLWLTHIHPSIPTACPGGFADLLPEERRFALPAAPASALYDLSLIHI